MTPRLSLGLEYNLAVGEISPTGNWIITPETARTPMVSLGTSSDRIFTPSGNQAYYVSFAKSIPGLPVAPYASVNYSEFEQGFNFPFGVNWSMTHTMDLLAMNDGRKFHLLLTFKQPSASLTFMLIDLKRPRIGVSLGWGF